MNAEGSCKRAICECDKKLAEELSGLEVFDTNFLALQIIEAYLLTAFSSNGTLSIINGGEVSTRSNSAMVLARSVLPDQSPLVPVNSDAVDHTQTDFSTSTQVQTPISKAALSLIIFNTSLGKDGSRHGCCKGQTFDINGHLECCEGQRLVPVGTCLGETTIHESYEQSRLPF